MVPSVTPPGRSPRRDVALVLTVLTGLWTTAALLGVNFLLWLVEEALAAGERPLPSAFWLLGAWLPVLLAGIPAALLAQLSKVPFARAIGHGWAVMLIFGGLLGSVRLIPNTFHELYLAVLALVAAIGAAVHRTLTGRAERGPGWLFWVGLAAGLAVLLPWLWAGAFGGSVETVLALVAALAVSWLATRPLLSLAGSTGIRNRWAGALVGGLAVGVGLTALTAGLGEPAINLLALLAVPPLAFTIALLARIDRAPLVALLTPALFGPLALVDPEETSLLLGTRDVAYWALIAAGLSFAVAVMVGLFGLITLSGRRPRSWLAATLAVAVAIGAVIVYTGVGRPGFYGEHVFVVMKEQADLGGLSAVPNRDERLRQTYRRLVDTAQRSQVPIRKALSDKGLRFTPYYLINGIEVDAGPVVRQWLASRSDVDRVLLNPRLRPLPEDPPPITGGAAAPSGPQWNLTLIHADQVWSTFGPERGTGKGIVIGSSDSGVDGSHPELRANFRGGDDSWLDPFNGSTGPVDGNGHGTHTMATVVGRTVGVAPGAQWMACVNLPRDLGNMGNYLTCLQFMLAPYPKGADPMRAGRPERAPHILTNSWGCPPVEGCDRNSLRRAVEVFSAAGIFFVAAAGNSGPDCGTVSDPPATYPATMTVGAVDRNRVVTDFSSRGPAPDGRPKPDIVAPGSDVLSALPGGGYGRLSGTSMAAPHVAGVVALMWSRNPALIGQIDQTRATLLRTAQPATLNGPVCGQPAAADATGAGLVDALAAVTAAEGPNS